MRRRIRIGTIVVLAVSGLGAYSAFAALQSADPQSSSSSISATQSNKESDSIQVRYPVTKTSPESYDEIGQLAPMDLKNPSNLKTEVEYDAETNCYVIHTRVAGVDVCTPFMLSAAEYTIIRCVNPCSSIIGNGMHRILQRTANRSLIFWICSSLSGHWKKFLDRVVYN